MESNNNRVSHDQLARLNATTVVRLRSQLDEIEQLHDEWLRLRGNSIQSMPNNVITESTTANELLERLDIMDCDFRACVKCLLSGISREKADQKLNLVYEHVSSRRSTATDDARELMRKLDRVGEELELRQAVTAVANRRQQLETMDTQHGPRIDKGRGPMKISKQSAATASVNSTSEQLRSSCAEDLRDEHKAKISKRYQWLVDKLNARSTAADMFQQGAITWRDVELIQSIQTPSLAAEALVQILMQQPYEVFRCFKSALKKTGQHDAYLMLADIDFTANAEHREIIRDVYEDLLDQIDVKYSGLVNVLMSKSVIDRRDKEEIEGDSTHIGRTEKLLSVLSRRSFYQFTKFVTALVDTGQQHVADLIRNRSKVLFDGSTKGQAPQTSLPTQQVTKMTENVNCFDLIACDTITNKPPPIPERCPAATTRVQLQSGQDPGPGCRSPLSRADVPASPNVPWVIRRAIPSGFTGDSREVINTTNHHH